MHKMTACMRFSVFPTLLLLVGAAVQSAEKPVLLRFREPVGTVLKYRTTACTKRVEARTGSLDGLHLKDIVIPATYTVNWELAVVSRDKSGLMNLVMPVSYIKTLSKEDVDKALKPLMPGTKGANSDTAIEKSTVLAEKVDDRGTITEAWALDTNFSWLANVSLFGPQISFTPYPKQAKSVGETWTDTPVAVDIEPVAAPTTKTLGASSNPHGYLLATFFPKLKSATTAFETIEEVNGHSCAKLVCRLQLDLHPDLQRQPDPNIRQFEGVQTEWIDLQGGYPVKVVLDLQFDTTFYPGVEESIHAETVLTGKTSLDDEKLSKARQFYNHVNSVLRHLQISLFSWGDREMSHAQRNSLMRASLKSASTVAPFDSWQKALSGVSAEEQHVEKMFNNVARRDRETDAATACLERYLKAMKTHDHVTKYNLYTKRLKSAWTADEYLRYQRETDPATPAFEEIVSWTDSDFVNIPENEIIMGVKLKGVDPKAGVATYLAVKEDGKWRIGNFGGAMPSWTVKLDENQSAMVDAAEQYIRSWCSKDAVAGASLSCSRDRKKLDAAEVKAQWEKYGGEPRKLVFVSVPDMKPDANPYDDAEDAQLTPVVTWHVDKTGKTLLSRNLKLPMCYVDGKWKVLQ